MKERITLFDGLVIFPLIQNEAWRQRLLFVPYPESHRKKQKNETSTIWETKQRASSEIVKDVVYSEFNQQ